LNARGIRIFVIGAKGYIGKCLYIAAKKLCAAYGTTSGTDDTLLHLDLGRPDTFDYALLDADSIVLLTAAISSPEACANQYDYAWSVNVNGTSVFIDRAIKRGARIVFFSSDTVYGEKDTMFDENAPCAPTGEYAGMKHEVENTFINNSLFKAIRLSYVFSRDDRFTRYLRDCYERGESAAIFHPFYRAVIHRDDVVQGVLSLAYKWDDFPQSIINFGGPEVLSRIDYCTKLREAIMPDLKFEVTTPDDSFFKKRPRVICMSSPILPPLLGRPLHGLDEAAEIEFEKA